MFKYELGCTALWYSIYTIAPMLIGGCQTLVWLQMWKYSSILVLQWPHSQPGQTWEARSHRPQCRPSLATFTVLGWRMGVPYKWGCFHLQVFPPFLAYVVPHNGADDVAWVSAVFASANNVCCLGLKLKSVQLQLCFFCFCFFCEKNEWTLSFNS